MRAVVLVLQSVANSTINEFPQALSLIRLDDAQILHVRFPVLHDDLVPVAVDGISEADVAPSSTVCGSFMLPRKLYCAPVAPFGS